METSVKKLFLLFVIAMTACSQNADPGADTDHAVPDAAVIDQAEMLNDLVEAYFDESIELNPLFATFIGDNRFNDRLANVIGPEYIDASLNQEQRFLAALDDIDESQLRGQDLLTYEIFRLNRENAIRGAQFPKELLPVNQMFSLPAFFAVMGSGKSVQPFVTVEDYDNFISRADDFVVYMDQAITNMRIGAGQGIVQPRVVMEKVLPQLQTLVVDDLTQSIFYGPVTNMPEEFSAEERDRLTGEYTNLLGERLIPAYRRMAEFIENEYLPQTRETVSLSALPDGKEWYAYLVENSTTTQMDPEEIHQLGLSEVARIRGEMEQVKQQVGFDGTLEEFFNFAETDPQFHFASSEELLAAYRDAKTRIDARLPTLFSVFPKADYEIREVESFRAQSSAGAFYQPPSPDGSRPGIFYINTFNLDAQPRFGVETLSLHEASPGHHFQISIQQELEDLPRFRRFGNYTAYAEGWALYSESIGRELGLFTDPYQYYGKLNDEQLRAMRLVVDTGLHAKGWTREQAIDYMLENSSLAESDVIAEVERYIAIPGQALAYKIGQLNLARMRAEAEAELGKKFDIKAWHAQILTDGALPLAVLDAKNRRWIQSQK